MQFNGSIKPWELFSSEWVSFSFTRFIKTTALSCKSHQNQGSGKTKAISGFLAGPSVRYGYDPIYIAGDNGGDQYMLSDFNGMITGLIINRFKGKGQILDDLTNQAVENYKKDYTMYLLQGRDDKTGAFVPRQK